MNTFNEAEFKNFESKIDDVLNLLRDMADSNNGEHMRKSEPNDPYDEDEFIVKVRDNRTVINKNGKQPSSNEPHKVDKFTFMKQLEQDAAMRAENRKNRESIAHNFRRMGNDAFRDQRYEEAINLYSKAIDHVKDSPILYNNRALTYIKKKLYKRALIDCDFVVNRLDEKNLRSWLYRALAYHNLDDEVNYARSIKMAKKHNSTEHDYIEKFIKIIKENKL